MVTKLVISWTGGDMSPVYPGYKWQLWQQSQYWRLANQSLDGKGEKIQKPWKTFSQVMVTALGALSPFPLHLPLSFSLPWPLGQSCCIMAFGSLVDTGIGGISCLNLGLSAGWRSGGGKALGPPERRNHPWVFCWHFWCCRETKVARKQPAGQQICCCWCKDPATAIFTSLFTVWCDMKVSDPGV